VNIDNIGTQLLYTTVPILAEKEDGTQVAGTGFLFNYAQDRDKGLFIPLIITNRHVVEGAKRGIIQFVTQENNLPIKEKRVRVEFDAGFFQVYIDSTIDLVAAPIAPLFQQLEQRNISIFYRSIDSTIIPDEKQTENLGAVEDVIFIGYPSGLFDSYNATPIIRRGITATPAWNNYNNESKFLIDAGVFPGSSGSPVFIFNQGSYPSGNNIAIGTRIYFLGVLTESILNAGIGDNRYFLGLGVVINSESLQQYLKALVSKLLASQSKQ